MQDLLEPRELHRIAEDLVGELPPIDLLVLAEDLRAERLHDRAVPDGAARLLVMDDRISVEHLRAEIAQHRRDGRLPRPDRAGEPDDARRHAPSPGSDALAFAHSS